MSGIDPKTQQPIFQYNRQGVRAVGAYQVSGLPFITGSTGQMSNGTEARIKFPQVTKSVTVINSGSAQHSHLKVHFASASAGEVTSDIGHHYITLGSTGDSVTFNVKCKEIYVTSVGTAGFELFAELTTIPTASMWNLNELSGSGLIGVRHDFSHRDPGA